MPTMFCVVRSLEYFTQKLPIGQVMTTRIMERGLSSGRIDDNEEAIRKRLVTYRESTMPIIKEFEARGKLREVNSDQTVGEKQKPMKANERAE